MTITQNIALDRLKISPHNVRKIQDKGALEELKASILSHGLLQSPLVTTADDGIHYVIAGARRVSALQALQKEGKLPKDHKARCQIADDRNAAELSLAENVIREAMHPADEFEAFNRLATKDKLPASKIAERFGVPEKHVQQRMRLARVAPELLKAYRAGDMTLDALMAFTLSDDHEHQKKVFKATGKNPGAHHVRRLMTEKAESSGGKLCKFVTLKKYIEAGGKVREDLFGSETFLDNPELLHELATAKLAEVSEKLKAEGWGWVETALEDEYGFTQKFGRIHPTPVDAPKKLTEGLAKLQAELEVAEDALGDLGHGDPNTGRLEDECRRVEEQISEAETELQGYRKYDPAGMKVAGVYARLDHDGKLRIDRGLVSRKEEKKLEQAKYGGAKPEQPEKKGLSQSLRLSLQAFRLQAAEAAVASKPELAYDLLVFSAAVSLLGEEWSIDGLDITFRDRTPMVDEVKDSPAAGALAEIYGKLPLKWLDVEEEAARFAAFRKLTAAQKASILAFCVALTLKPGLAPDYGDIGAHDVTLALTGVDVASYWRPAAGNYLGKITKDQLLEMGAGIFSNAWADKWKTAKKRDLVQHLDRAFADPARSSGNKATEQKLRSWLPEGMAFTLPEKPPAKPAKKAA